MGLSVIESGIRIISLELVGVAGVASLGLLVIENDGQGGQDYFIGVGRDYRQLRRGSVSIGRYFN